MGCAWSPELDTCWLDTCWLIHATSFSECVHHRAHTLFFGPHMPLCVCRFLSHLITSGAGTQQATVVENLESKKTYAFRVWASNSQGPGPPSHPVSYTIPAQPRRPKACRFGAGCRTRGAGCPFAHPAADAPAAAAARNVCVVRAPPLPQASHDVAGGDGSRIIVAAGSLKVCKFGAACRALGCKYAHPTQNVMAAQAEAKNGFPAERAATTAAVGGGGGGGGRRRRCAGGMCSSACAQVEGGGASSGV